MVDSTWEKQPKLQKEQELYLSVAVDVFCPGQSVILTQIEQNTGYDLIHRLAKNELNGKLSDELEPFEKYTEYYQDQVTYYEDPYFFSDWYGFMYYRNRSEYVFSFDKRLHSCVGYKVVNGDFYSESKSSVIVLEPNEDRTFLIKRTKS